MQILEWKGRGIGCSPERFYGSGDAHVTSFLQGVASLLNMVTVRVTKMRPTGKNSSWVFISIYYPGWTVCPSVVHCQIYQRVREHLEYFRLSYWWSFSYWLMYAQAFWGAVICLPGWETDGYCFNCFKSDNFRSSAMP